jgi:hypothetical protein
VRLLAAYWLFFLCAASAYWLGLRTARHDQRKVDRAWADGYAAGLAKADDMWPAVRRWSMHNG